MLNSQKLILNVRIVIQKQVCNHSGKDDDNNCTEFYDDIKMIVCDESFAAKIQTALEKHLSYPKSDTEGVFYIIQ